LKEDDILNGFILLVPFILIRFGLLIILNKEALKQAAFFAPLALAFIYSTHFWVRSYDLNTIPPWVQQTVLKNGEPVICFVKPT